MLLRVKAFPAAKEEKIVKKAEDNFEVYVKERPVRGMANKRIIAVLAATFNIPPSTIKLIKGWQERNKIFAINGFNATK